jgi:hypothetical protein
MRRLPNQPRQPLLTAAQWHVPKVLAVELEKVEGVQRGLADGAAAAGAIPAIAGTVGDRPHLRRHRQTPGRRGGLQRVHYTAADDIDGLMWAAHHALEELIETTPTTLPGVVALLRHLGEPDVGHDPDYTLLGRVLGEEYGGPFDVRDAAEKLPGIRLEPLGVAFATVSHVGKVVYTPRAQPAPATKFST